MASLGSLVASLELQTASFTRGWSEAVSATRASTTEIARQTRAIDRGFQDVENQLHRVTRVIDTAKLAFAALGGAFVVRDIVQAGVAFEGFHNALEAVFGSSRQASQEFEFVRSTADKLGISLKDAAYNYTQLAAASQGTALAGEETRKIFTAVSGSMQVLGRTTEQTQGALRAIEQIISKGTVQAEELRGQLGERLSGAFVRAADAIGLTTSELDKLLKSGGLSAQQFLPAFRAEIERTFGPAFAKAAESARAELNRFSTAIFELKVDLARSGLLDGVITALGQLRETLRSPEIRSAVQELGERLGQGFRLAGEAIVFASRNFDALLSTASAFLSFRIAETVFSLAAAFGRLATSILTAQSAMVAFNRVSSANVFAAGISAAVAAAIYFQDSIIEIGNVQVRVGRVIEAAWQAISGVISSVAQLISTVFSSMFEQGISQLSGLVRSYEAFGVVLSTIFEQALSQVNGLIQAYEGLANAIRGAVNLDPSAILSGLREASAGIVDAVTLDEEVRSRFVTASKELGDSLAQAVTLDSDKIHARFTEAGEAAASGFSAPFDAVTDLMQDIEKETADRLSVGISAEDALAELDLLAQAAVGTGAALEGLSGAGSSLDDVADTDFSSLLTQSDAFAERMRTIEEATATARVQLEALPTVGFELGRIDDLAAARDAMLDWAQANELTALSFEEIEAKAAEAGLTVAGLAAQFSEQRALEIGVGISRDLTAELQQLQLLIQFAGQETEEYRVQVGLLEDKQRAGEAFAQANEALRRSVEAARTTAVDQAATASITKEAELLEKQLELRGLSTAEMEKQLALYTAMLENEGRLSEAQAAAITRRADATENLARNDVRTGLQDQIQLQRRLVELGGQETAEYRVHAQWLELKKRHGEDFANSQLESLRLLEQQGTQLKAAQEFNDLFDTEVMKNTIRGVQGALTDFFANTLRDGVANWKDLWNSFKELAIRTIAEVAAQMVFKPIVQFLIGGAAGLGGGLGGGLDPLGGASGTLSLAMGGLTNSLNDFASRIGLAGGAYNQTGLLGTAPFSQTLGAGALGFFGGGAFANLLGLNQTGGSLGGGLGAALGFGLTGGNPLGALLGGGLGSLLGGGFGSLFGDDEFNPRVTVGTGGRRGRFEPGVRPVEGPFGQVAPLDIGTHETAAALDQQIANMVVEFDKAIAGVLNDRQEKVVTKLLRGSSSSEVGFNEFELGEEGFILLKERLESIFNKIIPNSARPDAFNRIFGDLQPDEDNPQVVQQLTERAKAVIEFLNAFKAFEKGKVPEPPSELAARLAEISARFQEMRGIAKDLGLDLSVLRRAERQEVRAVRQEVVGNLQVLAGNETGFGRELEQQFVQLNATLTDVANNLKELGLSPEKFSRLEQGAIKNFRGDVTDQAREISGLGSATSGIDEFTNRLLQLNELFKFMADNLDALGMDKEDFREFKRKNKQALRENFIDEIESFGPEHTGAAAEFAEALDHIRETFRDAAQAADEFGVSQERIGKLEKEAVSNLRGNLKEQARELSGLGSSTSGIDQFVDRMRQLNELFEFMADNLGKLGMSKENFREFKQENRQALRDDFIERLKSFGPEDSGAVAEFARQLKEIKEVFRDAARAAEEFGVSQRKVDKLEKQAAKALKIDVKQDIKGISGIEEIEGALGAILEQGVAMNEMLDFLQENTKALRIDPKDLKQFRRDNRKAFRENLFEELEEFATGGETNPFLERLKEIEETFRTVRESADEFNLALGHIDRLQRQATEALREDLLDSLKEFAGIGGEFAGLVDVAERMREQFAFARENASRFGLSLEQIGRLQRRAEENIREQFLEQLESFSQASGGSPIDQFIRRMEEIDRVFREASERAREFGVSQDQVRGLRRDAVEQAEEDLVSNLTGLIGESSDPLERLRNQFREIVTVFDEARSVAQRYGISLRDLNQLQQRALDTLSEDVLGRLEDDLKNQAEAIGGLFDQFMDPLENLQRELQLGGGGALAPRMQFENAREQFRNTLTRAEGGDVGALRDLDAAARAFLEAARAGGSGVFAEAFQEVQAILPDLLRQLQEQRDEAMAGLPDVNRNLEELVREQRQQAQETIDLLREIRNFLREQGRSVADGSTVRRVGR